MASIIFATLAGITVALQNSLNGMMSPIIGAMGASAVSFGVQMLLLIAVYVFFEKEKTGFGRVPKYCYSGGLIAALVVGVIAVCVSEMGSAVTTCCSVAGQIIMSAVVDHFGLFGNRVSRFSLRRLPGFILIIAGVFSINLISGGGAGGVSIGLLLLAVLMGSAAVLVRTMNYKATQATGSTLAGGIVNSVSGAFFAAVLFGIVTLVKPTELRFGEIPPVCLAAGLLGGACLLCNIMAYKREQVFYATVFMLVGQVVTGIVIDIAVFGAMSVGKCVGIAIVVAGVMLDKLIARKQ